MTPHVQGIGYLPLVKVAQWSGVSVRTLRRWLGQGLPFYQAGVRHRVLIRPEDVTAFLTRHETPRQDLNALVEETMNDLLTRSTP